jgi:hypothetical protein
MHSWATPSPERLAFFDIHLMVNILTETPFRILGNLRPRTRPQKTPLREEWRWVERGLGLMAGPAVL